MIYSGEYDADIARYVPGTLQLMFQGMLNRVNTIEQPTRISYKDLETFNFQLLLDKNLYTNLNSLHLCFIIKFKKETNVALNLENNVITVNKFLSH